jgi:hypothetical protein
VNPTESIVDNGYIINRYSQEAWWKITPTDITGGTYTLSLGAYGISGVGNNTLLRILKRADSQQPWGFSGNHTTGTGSNSEPMVKRSGITDGFSEFGIGGNSADGNPLNDIPLQVVMKMFMSEVSGNGVRLRWETEGEINCAGYEVERKCGGGEYVKAGYVSAKGAGKYEFADKGLQAGRYAYRIKQIDNNGNFAYYELAGEVVIGVPESYVLGQNFPNPFNPVTKIIPDRRRQNA